MSRTPGSQKELLRIAIPDTLSDHLWIKLDERPLSVFGVQIGRDTEGAFVLSAAEYPEWSGHVEIVAVRGLSAYIETLPDGSTGRNDTPELQILAEAITKEAK